MEAIPAVSPSPLLSGEWRLESDGEELMVAVEISSRMIIVKV